jgi:N-acetylmuramoyl-L-alanine amidase
MVPGFICGLLAYQLRVFKWLYPSLVKNLHNFIAVATEFRDRRSFSRVLLGLLLLPYILFPGYAANEKHVSIYSNVANYTLPVIDREGHEYVGLLEVLDPLGGISVQTQNSRWTIRYNGTSSEFFDGKPKVRIKNHDFEMPARFILENGRGLVPVSALSTLLARILGGPVTFHETSRRLFIGGVAVHFTAQMGKTDPPSLIMNFSSPVNPMISTEPGKLVMIFTRDPLVAPGTQSLSFDSKEIPAATYEESNGSALVTVNGSSSLFASFSNGGRTITITTPKQTGAANPQVTTSNTPPNASASPAAATPATPAPAPLPLPPVRYFAVIDASHGGDERGAALSDKLAEKDVTLAVARRLRFDLQAQGMPALLLRDGDNSLTLDQRAQLTNRAHPAIYISIHVSSQGTGVRLYTSLVPATENSLGIFLDWNSAQTAYLPISRAFATNLGGELGKKRITARILLAPIRPLNNITRPAIAIELALPSTGLAYLNSPSYHELVSSSVATALLSMRSQLEAGR